MNYRAPAIDFTQLYGPQLCFETLHLISLRCNMSKVFYDRPTHIQIVVLWHPFNYHSEWTTIWWMALSFAYFSKQNHSRHQRLALLFKSKLRAVVWQAGMETELFIINPFTPSSHRPNNQIYQPTFSSCSVFPFQHFNKTYCRVSKVPEKQTPKTLSTFNVSDN